MESGNIVEYIDRQKIMCAVVLEVKNKRLRLLTENNREANLAASRLSHQCEMRLDMSMGRDKMVDALKEIANRRKALIPKINIKELWEVLNSEQEWIDLATMTEFCFPNSPSGDHESAVVRAFFQNRSYFKFNADRFFPFSEEQVQRMIAQAEETARRDRLIEAGGSWLKAVLNADNPDLDQPMVVDRSEIIDILKSYYLFEKESPHYSIGRALLAKAGIDHVEGVFNLLMKLGVFDENENLDLYRLDIATSFPDAVTQCATRLIQSPAKRSAGNERRDLTMLPLMTIDGQGTMDYDDALSLEDKGDHIVLGVHIADVGDFIEKGGVIDQEAFARGSSIYMPDQKIPMLPSDLAEGLCSLKAGELRPAISSLVKLSRSWDIIDYEIIPSLISVKNQLTYYDVNTVVDENRDIKILWEVASKFRQARLDEGALEISLPEVNVWVHDDGEIAVTKLNRESPGRMLVAELMIMANWLMARFLVDHDIPAIFRSQPGPRERLFKGNEGTLFQNWMQRRLLSRFVLDHKPERHSGLGVNAYTTATSPIRKYFDLTTQRQIRSAFGLETPYSSAELDRIIQALAQPMSSVSRIQHRRNRYWLLKYLEKKVGQREEAIVLNKRRNSFQILLTEYMLECDLPLSNSIDLKAEDLVQVKIQHVNARNDVISVFMG
jgi:exoribonuclease-2